jgi:hypothetical protein
MEHEAKLPAQIISLFHHCSDNTEIHRGLFSKISVYYYESKQVSSFSNGDSEI